MSARPNPLTRAAAAASLNFRPGVPMSTSARPPPEVTFFMKTHFRTLFAAGTTVALTLLASLGLRANDPAPAPHASPAPAAHGDAAAPAAHGAPTQASHAPAAHTAPKPVTPAAHAGVSALTPTDAALQRLLDGNARYAAGHATYPNQTVARRVEVARGQAPFAAIVTCSDSRVPPELFLDQGLGDLFVVRDAGIVLTDHVIGSLEDAVEHLHVSVILVIGHEKCGAVSAAVAGGHAEGRIGSIIDSIRPAVKETRNQAGDKVDNAIRANARRGAVALAGTAPILSHAVHTGEIKIFAARYDLASGRVELLP